MHRRILLSLSLFFAAIALAAEKPTVLLISLDGFRYDYAEKYQAKNLLAFAKHGVQAKAMLPVFPTTTFPNHYSIVTGLYPAHHGIVENAFWDPALGLQFRFNDSKVASDTRFWGGTPLWVLAEKQGVPAACYFWPGSDYEIAGKRPSYWYPYDGKTKKEAQVAQVVQWLRLTADKRPHFITLYFSDVDHAGHNSGPDSAETKAAVLELDRVLGDLFDKIRRTKVKVDIFVVSDHGMTNTETPVDLGKLANFDGVKTSGSGTAFHVYSKDVKKIDEIYEALKKSNDARFAVYRKAEIPTRLHYLDNDRIGDLVVFSTGHTGVGVVDPKRPPRTAPAPKGGHGIDVALIPEMKASFFAAGPHIRRGMVIEEFENINIYPLIAHLLRLEVQSPIDGDLKVLKPILK